ncbi:ribbon-helix-helix protein, CopG family [Plantibacter sp. YIM 135347]|uniref:ribbon-helix-helix protein, CopG family n=1 Tax=Plantibacter sp. YIM 135347 TaxID=3423919 RepID=UPI003D33CE4F
MSTSISPSQQARYAELAARMEAGDFGPIPTAPVSTEVEAGAELDELLAQLDDRGIDQSAPTPAPPASSETVDAAEVRKVLGRPSLSGTDGAGLSPKRQVRLPADLNALLDARAAAEHRNASEIMRDALVMYLHAS